MSSIPGQRTRSHLQQLRVCTSQLKILCATAKTWHSHTNKQVFLENQQTSDKAMVVMQGRHTGSNEDRKMSIKVLEMTSYPAKQRYFFLYSWKGTSLRGRAHGPPLESIQKTENYSSRPLVTSANSKNFLRALRSALGRQDELLFLLRFWQHGWPMWPHWNHDLLRRAFQPETECWIFQICSVSPAFTSFPPW